MKKILLLFALVVLVGTTALAAVPSGYYNNAKGKSGQALQSALHQIIRGHTKRTYDNLWSDFKKTDCNGNTIIDRYSTTQFTYSTNQCGTYSGVGDCYNREHSIPNSWWGGSSSDTAYTDLHHMFPVDGWVNSQRGNNPFGDCANGTPKGTGKLGSCTFSGYSGTVFEVADEYKGDFARVYFYFATRYMSRISSFTVSTGSVVFTTSSTAGHLGLTTWAINQLLEWHRNDPVSALEIARNEAVYGIQNNRNPFVDNPELVEYLWGNMQGNAWESGSTPTPTLTSPTNGSTVNVGTNTGSGVNKIITVSGSNLTSALTVSVSGTGFSVSPTTLTASSVNNGTTVTVTYNGTATNATGTLTIGSTEVSATVNLTASYNSGTGPTPGDEVVETWEGCSGYDNYTNKTVQGKVFTWYFSNAGIFAQSNDHWNDQIGCRFGKNANSYIEMSEDFTYGASKVTFYAANYGSDATPTMKVQYSTNSGNTWTDLATCSLNSTWKQYSYDLNVTGNVRFKFVQTAGSRLNIDDIAITSNSGAVTNPQITAPTNGSTVNVGTIAATGTSVSKTITVRGSDLTKALNVSVSGTGFCVSPTSISAANANAGTAVTVTYTSNTPGDATGTLTISSSEASVTVNLTASKIAMPSISITPLSPLEAEQNGASTIVSGTVSADDNNEAITLSVDGNFELSLNRTDWSTSLTLDPSGEVFYVRLASTANVGDYYGEVSASTSLVSAYADVEGSVVPKPVQLGDVDKDGHVTVADVAALIQYLLLGSPSDTTIDIDAADVSQDGSISVGDVSALINYLLTAPTLTQARVWDAYPAQNGIVIENPAEEELEVYDFEGNCIASAFSDVHISLPAGIYVVASDTSSRKVVVK